MLLIADYQLPLTSPDEEQEGAWSCSLCWLPLTSAMTTPTFYMVPADDDCSFHAQLAVGCTNGHVFNLKWEISGVSRVPGRKSHGVSSINGITGVCSVSGVSGVKGCVSRISKLWEKADGVAVFSMASQSRGVSPVPLFVGKTFGDFFLYY